MDFPTKLAKLMDARDWNQADLCRRVGGVSASTVGNWLAGRTRPGIEDGLRIARALGVSLDYLADDEADAPPAEFTEQELRMISIAREIGIDESIRRLLLVQLRPANIGGPVASLTKVIGSAEGPDGRGFNRRGSKG